MVKERGTWKRGEGGSILVSFRAGDSSKPRLLSMIKYQISRVEGSLPAIQRFKSMRNRILGKATQRGNGEVSDEEKSQKKRKETRGNVMRLGGSMFLRTVEGQGIG